LPANVAKEADKRREGAMGRREEDVGHHQAHVVVMQAALAVHHATIATSPVTSLAIARNLEPRLATTAARTVIFLVNVTLLIAVAAEAEVDHTEVNADAM